MRQVLQRIVRAACLMLSCAAPHIARAAVAVEQYQTVAGTNGYAPFSKAQYYAEQDLLNVSPATADVSGDWTGTNAGGSSPTWHWVGSSHVGMITNVSASSVNVTGNGSFSFSLMTTSNFIDPANAGGVYSPAGGVDYGFQFDIDAPATYSVSVLMTGYSVMELGSFDGTYPFLRSNSTPASVPFAQTGTIPAGRYFLDANAGLGVGNLPNGANDYSASGSFSNYNFTLQLPEPALGCGVVLIGAGVAALKRRL